MGAGNTQNNKCYIYLKSVAILALSYNTCGNVIALNFSDGKFNYILTCINTSAKIPVLRIYTKKIIKICVKLYMCVYNFIISMFVVVLVLTVSKYIVVLHSYNWVLCHHLKIPYRFNLHTCE